MNTDADILHEERQAQRRAADRANEAAARDAYNWESKLAPGDNVTGMGRIRTRTVNSSRQAMLLGLLRSSAFEFILSEQFERARAAFGDIHPLLQKAQKTFVERVARFGASMIGHENAGETSLIFSEVQASQSVAAQLEREIEEVTSLIGERDAYSPDLYGPFRIDRDIHTLIARNEMRVHPATGRIGFSEERLEKLEEEAPRDQPKALAPVVVYRLKQAGWDDRRIEIAAAEPEMAEALAAGAEKAVQIAVRQQAPRLILQ